MPDFSKPHTISEVDLAFPAKVVGVLLPRMQDIPEEFKKVPSHNKWIQAFNHLFFKGAKEGMTLVGKKGIDAEKAYRHITACMRSFEPKHEHKEAGVAYLMSLWLEDIIGVTVPHKT